MKRAILATLLLLMPQLLLAQTGSIAGTVTDASGNPLANAIIQAANPETKTFHNATSSATGAFIISGLPAGRYFIVVDAKVGLYRTRLTVGSGETVRVDARIVEDVIENARRLDVALGTLGEADVRDIKRAVHPTPEGPTPRTADGKPDLSGMWWPQRIVDAGRPEPLPWALALIKERAENHFKDYPLARCLPGGPTLFGYIDFYRIVQTPTHLIMIDENDVPGHRQVFLDGRPHPKEPNPTWMGHSVGTWEGDTLVVDTVGLNDKTWITMAISPHTEAMHLIERYRRPDLGHLEVELTIIDPKTYARPWTIKRVSDLAPKEDVMEFICTENNRDVEHMVGK